LPVAVLKDAIQLPWGGNAKVFALVSEKAFDPAVRWYRRCAMLALLRAALRSHDVVRSFGDKRAGLLLDSLLANVVKELDAVADEASVKTRLLFECFEILCSVLVYFERTAFKKVGERKDEVRRCLIDLASRVRVRKRQDALKPLRKLAQKINLPFNQL
jgi:hypothetical protein